MPPTPSPTPRPTSVMEEKEKPQAYPSCYNNLMAGRTTGQVSSVSPGQVNQPGKLVFRMKCEKMLIHFY